MTTDTAAFPVLRWVGLVWMLVWLPAYMRVWGWANLLHLCDVAVILGCAGLWWGSSLLVSSQAVSSLAAGILWGLDVGARLLTGRFLVGGTEYMWDVRAPISVRLLSSFHLGLPFALLWAVRKIAYDRRALALQAASAAVLLVASRFLPSGFNMNYAYQDPVFHRSWGPAPVHLAVIFLGAVALLYLPTHLLLSWMFPVAGAAKCSDEAGKSGAGGNGHGHRKESQEIFRHARDCSGRGAHWAPGRRNPHRCGAIRTRRKTARTRPQPQSAARRSLRTWRNGCFSKSGPAAELSRQNYGDDAGAVLVLQWADPPVWDRHCSGRRVREFPRRD